MSGHTPGPWRHDGDGDIYGADGSIVAYGNSGQRAIPCDDDANLIAAAPDLLEALIAIEAAYSQVTNWEHAGSTDRNPQLTSPVAIAARKAIARAKGEA